ncbi:hypothetical protein L1987_65421 [Smallanthus sonchifolius]|uniref:Uncharacterized protein n=1 Tax=Smallanthus sonchifolius TaxID=185202 RepID=A0ACB9BUE1_9ASTR|nr:hypothetical protein L1987_65421 [Smallanthus sonchifolius]
MCISAATPKKPTVLQQYVAPKGLYEVAVPVDTDLTNTIVYIGNMTLLQVMTSAEEEIQRMDGSQIGQLVVHLSWGKSKRIYTIGLIWSVGPNSGSNSMEQCTLWLWGRL